MKIWYVCTLTCEDINDFTDIKFVSLIVLKFDSVSSKHLRVFLGSLRQSSEIFGNFPKMFRSVRLAFRTILENFRKSLGSGRKSSENHQKHQVYIIKRTLHVGSKIWILCSSGKNNILFLPRDICSPPCNILYISNH